MKKRMGYLELKEEITLDKAGLFIRAFSKRGEFVGRLEFSNAGVAAYVGAKGRKCLGDFTWERFFERLQ
jgi:hypothetical protein